MAPYVAFLINFSFKVVVFFLIYGSVYEIVRGNVLYTGKDFCGISFYDLLSVIISTIILNFITVKVV